MPTSFIASSAQVGAETSIGHFCMIGEDVRIGSACQIGHHVVLHPGTIVGQGVRIDDHTVLGKQPMRASNSAVTRNGEQPPARIGSRCLVGTGVVIYAGCTLGENVLVADGATVREEVTIGDFTIVGRGVAIENQCRVGCYCKLETNVYLTAYSTVEDQAFIAPGVLTSNDNFMGRSCERFKYFKGLTVRRGGRLGVGAVTLPGREVGPDAVVAAGALLTKDAASGQIYAGVPARPFRGVPEEQRLENQEQV